MRMRYHLLVVHTPRPLDSQLQKTVFTDRSGVRACTALLVAAVLCAGVFGIGHHHADDELLDEHHCALCHVQPISVEPTRADVVVPVAGPQGRAHVGESGFTASLALRLTPPLRGPPIR